MSDLHISSMLISGAAQGAGPVDTTLSAAGALPTGADAFSAVLAGKLDQPESATSLPELTGGADNATLTPLIALDSNPEAPRDTASGAQPENMQSTTDAGTQLLMAMGVLPAQAATSPASAPVATAVATEVATRVAPPAATLAAAPASPTSRSSSQSTSRPDQPAALRPAFAGSAQPMALAPHTSVPPPALGLDVLITSVGLAAARAAGLESKETASLPGTSSQSSPAGTFAVDLPTTSATQAAVTGFTSSTLAAPAHLAVQGSVGTPQWNENFASGVRLLATQRISSAELRVQPAELGPIQVSIRIDAGETSIVCTAQHPDTRQALDAALPRLREMLEANGISVGNASVGPQFSGNGSSQSHQGTESRHPSPFATTTEPVQTPVPRTAVRTDQLVDIFA